MHEAGRWVFGAAVVGTLAYPFVVGLMSWLAPAGLRTRASLFVAGGWLAFCIVAGVARLASDDAYFSPNHVSYWAQAAPADRRAIVALLAATAAVAVLAIALGAMRARRPGIAVILVSAGWLIAAAAMANLLALGLH
jgi:hypothetical protein